MAAGDAQRRILVYDEVLRNDSGRDPVLDIALGPAQLQMVATSGGPDLLRIYQPRPTLAFSGRDCASAGIGEAIIAARDAGFTPVRRGPGGRAAAYHRGTLCLDHVGSDEGEMPQTRSRFVVFGELLGKALRAVGVDAHVGPVPGEYCHGEFSLNDGHGHKVVGTAQRLVRGGWLFSTVIVVSGPESIRAVLTPVYQALHLEWDPGTVAAVASTVPGTTVRQVKDAVLEAYSELGIVQHSSVPAAAIDSALRRQERHRLSPT